MWSFCPSVVAPVSSVFMLTEFVLVSENGEELAMNIASQNWIVCCYYYSCVAPLVSSLLISELHFSHSVSPLFGLIVSGIIKALCSLAV